MEIKIDKSFQKDTRRIRDKSVLQKVANTIANVQRAQKLDCPDLEMHWQQSEMPYSL